MLVRTTCLVALASGIAGCSDTGADREGGTGGSAGSGDAGAPGPFPSPVPDDCIRDVSTGFRQIDCEELQFDVEVPEVCLERACGLIFDVHGLGMNAELEELHTKIRQVGTGGGYIVVQPSAPGMVPDTSWDNDVNDAHVFAFMQRIIASFHVDADRVHIGGLSQGGFMTWRFICEHADVIASAAPIAAGQDSAGQRGCDFASAASRQVPIFYTHGRTDGLVPFTTASAQRDTVLAAYGLSESEVVEMSAEHDWRRYRNPAGTVFEFLEHDWETAFALGARPLGGHCVPGSGEFLGCGADNAVNWGQAVVQFYMDHPR